MWFSASTYSGKYVSPSRELISNHHDKTKHNSRRRMVPVCKFRKEIMKFLPFRNLPVTSHDRILYIYRMISQTS